MKSLFALPLLALLPVLFLSACNKSSDSEIMAILQQNAQAAQSENLAAYMNTYHSKAQARQALKAMMPNLFKFYNLKYTVSDVQVESSTAEEIRARYTLLTQKADSTGPPFRNNKTGQTVTFKKENGQWKIYEGKVNKIEYVE
jgi:ketosteroid isomerase-like protein